MGPLVGAIGGILIASFFGVVIAAQNWKYVRKNHELGGLVAQCVIGGGVAGAIIGLFL